MLGLVGPGQLLGQLGDFVLGLVVQFAVENQDIACIFYVAAAALGLPALTGTFVALPGYWLWMGVAFVMGNIVSRVLLAAVFYGLMTPMGLIRRLFDDKLRLRRRAVESYWTDIRSDGDEARYHRLF